MYVDRETANGIVESLDGLTDAQRQAFALFLMGYKHQEIADMLGIERPAVTRRLSRAIQHIERALKSM